jgi:hypothetical protein
MFSDAIQGTADQRPKLEQGHTQKDWPGDYLSHIGDMFYEIVDGNQLLCKAANKLRNGRVKISHPLMPC